MYTIKTVSLLVLASILPIIAMKQDPFEPLQTKDINEAAQKGYMSTLQKLLNCGISIETIDKEGYSPLQRAAEMGQYEAAQLLLKRGALVNEQSRCGYSPVFLSTLFGFNNVTTLLVSQGADLDIPNKTIGKENYGFHTALGRALCLDNSYLANFLLIQGASPTAALPDLLDKEKNNKSFLHKNRRRMLARLIAGGLDVTECDTQDNSILKEIIATQNMKLLRVLWHMKNMKIPFTQNELHEAARWGSPEIISLLIAQGALVNALNKHAETPLHIAALEGHPAALLTLIQNRSAINSSNKRKETPLHYAVQNLMKHPDNDLQQKKHFEEKKKVIQILVYLGADCEAKNSRGATAADSIDRKIMHLNPDMPRLVGFLRNPYQIMKTHSHQFSWILDANPPHAQWIQEQHEFIMNSWLKIEAMKAAENGKGNSDCVIS